MMTRLVPTNNQIKFKISILRSSLIDYSEMSILVTVTITVTGKGDDEAARQTTKN